MDAINTFVTQTGTAVVECPHCENSKAVSVSTLKGKKHSVNVKCSCGKIFAINLDFREHYRKQTLFEGNYGKTNLKIESYYERLPRKTDIPLNHTLAVKNCTVKDLSCGGIGLDIWGRHTIEEGDKLYVEFYLDNKKHSHIKVEVTVKTVQKNYVGAEFKDKLGNYPELGFYLLP